MQVSKGDRVSFTYGKGSIGYGYIKRVYKFKPPVIKFDKTVPPTAVPINITVLTKKEK